MKVFVTETLCRTVEVSAQNEEEAIEKVSRSYYEGDIVLGSMDFVDVEFQVDCED